METKVDEILLNVDGLAYNKSARRFRVTASYILSNLNVNLTTLYGGTKNAFEILDRVSRQFYNNVYDEKTWPEDFEKKQYIILTDEDIVKLSRDIMTSHMESVVLTRRDLLALEHGIDLDGNKLIEDFDKNMELYQFSLDTRRMFNQNRVLRYKERLNLRDINVNALQDEY